MDAFLSILVEVLKVLFAIGVLGCGLVIPMTAAQLFRVLFQKDSDAEIAGRGEAEGMVDRSPLRAQQ